VIHSAVAVGGDCAGGLLVHECLERQCEFARPEDFVFVGFDDFLCLGDPPFGLFLSGGVGHGVVRGHGAVFVDHEDLGAELVFDCLEELGLRRAR
jgi:hypothetical protein